ncbi:MAG: EFR1 family ferrodoxin, partial [Clostridia bacterium]|nr:EFR1 family ferrodoxin [Clostridia bacterium]
KNLRVRQNTYLFLYANSGGSLGNALYNMDQILGTEQVKARFEVVFPDNNIAFATKKEKIPTMLTDGEKIVEIHASQIYHQKVTHKSPKNLMLKTVEKAVIPFSKMFLGFGNMKLNSELCNGCGLCSQVCTMKNIKMTNSKDGWVPTFEKNCSMCFACLHFCPQEAIRLKSMSNKKENYQYHHPDISVKELIDAQL